MATVRHTAWVPDLPTAEAMDDAIDVAIAWVEQRCRVENADAALLTPLMGDLFGLDGLQAFASRHTQVSPRSRGRWQRGQGPVLAYVPDDAALDLAMGMARGSSLCVVEGYSTPLAGWALATDAQELTGSVVLPDLSEQALAALEQLHFHGNNGWGDEYGKRRAADLLPRLLAEVDIDIVCAWMLGRGRSGAGAKRLRALAVKRRR